MLLTYYLAVIASIAIETFKMSHIVIIVSYFTFQPHRLTW